MVIDISSKVPDDKSEYCKINLAETGYDFKKLNLSPEDAMIVKKYLYYSRKLHNHSNADNIELSVAYQLLIQMVFLYYNKECALRILSCLADDLAKKNMKRAWIAAGSISGVYSYLYECEKEKKEKGEM